MIVVMVLRSPKEAPQGAGVMCVASDSNAVGIQGGLGITELHAAVFVFAWNIKRQALGLRGQNRIGMGRCSTSLVGFFVYSMARVVPPSPAVSKP